METTKYRVWDKDKKVMHYGPDITKNPTGSFLIDMNGNLLRVDRSYEFDDVVEDRYVEQLSIGTHDKHGKDIYASDIVKSEKYQKQGVVRYNERDCSWYVGDLMIRFFVADGPHDLEIIGNACENPELL